MLNMNDNSILLNNNSQKLVWHGSCYIVSKVKIKTLKGGIKK